MFLTEWSMRAYFEKGIVFVIIPRQARQRKGEIYFMKKLPIRKKLLLNMIMLSVIPVFVVTGVALFFMYNTMHDQLIYHRRMSSGWLQDRIGLELDNYRNQFYEFEVNKRVKEDIIYWCQKGEGIDYVSKWRIITNLNMTISMDSNINSIEVVNLSNGMTMLAERSKATTGLNEEVVAGWKERDASLQTEIVLKREEEEIQVIHGISRFPEKEPIALLIIKIRPYALQNILETIKVTEDETILIFNDEGQLIEGDYGEDPDFSLEDSAFILEELEGNAVKEAKYNGHFWFYRNVQGGKLKILQAVPDSIIVSALSNTILGGILVALSAVGASILFSIFFSRMISKPIIALSKKMRTLTLDNYHEKDETKRDDEIGILQKSFGIMIKHNKELIAKEYKEKIEKRNAQINALQAQINPHFMYNTLQVIGGMALKKKAPEIYGVTLDLSDIMRYSLSFKKEMVCLSEEIKYLEHYLAIQNQRFGNRLEVVYDVEEHARECLIPKLILQPLVENSFEHGLAEKEGKWIITLSAKIEMDADLIITVWDNGVGIERERLLRIEEMLNSKVEKVLLGDEHIGLCNVNSRIRLKYSNDKYGVRIENGEVAGTVVTVRLKTERKQDEEVAG